MSDEYTYEELQKLVAELQNRPGKAEGIISKPIRLQPFNHAHHSP